METPLVDKFGKLVVKAFGAQTGSLFVDIEGGRQYANYGFDPEEVVRDIIKMHDSGNTPTKGDVRRMTGIRVGDALADGKRFEEFDERVMCRDFFQYDSFGDDLSDEREENMFESRDWDKEPYPVEELMKHVAERRLNGDNIVPDVIIELALK